MAEPILVCLLKYLSRLIRVKQEAWLRAFLHRIS